MSSIVIYYSRAAENYFGGGLKYLKKGNTEVVAEKIAAMTGAELFKCEQLVPYSDGYNQCTEEAKADLQSGARPEIKPFDKDISQYDTCYICYPNYWGTIPMAMFTLLESIDFTGKHIKPLCTHEGSGMGKSENDLKKCCPGATVEAGLAIKGSSVLQCDDVLEKWIKK